jgi:hypothetical protein
MAERFKIDRKQTVPFQSNQKLGCLLNIAEAPLAFACCDPIYSSSQTISLRLAPTDLCVTYRADEVLPLSQFDIFRVIYSDFAVHDNAAAAAAVTMMIHASIAEQVNVHVRPHADCALITSCQQHAVHNFTVQYNVTAKYARAINFYKIVSSLAAN